MSQLQYTRKYRSLLANTAYRSAASLSRLTPSLSILKPAHNLPCTVRKHRISILHRIFCTFHRYRCTVADHNPAVCRSFQRKMGHILPFPAGRELCCLRLIHSVNCCLCLAGKIVYTECQILRIIVFRTFLTVTDCHNRIPAARPERKIPPSSQPLSPPQRILCPDGLQKFHSPY